MANAPSGNWDANGDWDATAAPFSEAELEIATDLRQRTSPAPGQTRKDRCPHEPMCPSLTMCIEAIAWYRRHQRIIEAATRRTR